MIYGVGQTIPLGSLWFLPHLFIASIISLSILKLINSNVFRLLIASLLLLAGIQSIAVFAPIGLPWSLDLAPITSSFMIFGYLFRARIESMQFHIYFFLISFIGFCGLHYGYNETMDLNLRIYGDPLISTARAGFGIYLILSIATLLDRQHLFGRALIYIGSGSVFILIFHVIFQDVPFWILSKISDTHYINGVVSLLFGIIGPLLFLEIAKKNAILSKLLLPQKVGVSIIPPVALQFSQKP